MYAIDEHKSSDPQRGMCFIPRRALSTPECEIARAYKITSGAVEPIAFIVPRKVTPAPSTSPSLSKNNSHAHASPIRSNPTFSRPRRRSSPPSPPASSSPANRSPSSSSPSTQAPSLQQRHLLSHSRRALRLQLRRRHYQHRHWPRRSRRPTRLPSRKSRASQRPSRHLHRPRRPICSRSRRSCRPPVRRPLFTFQMYVNFFSESFF